MTKKVAFYTSVHFLDAALETIHVLREAVDLHVYVEITPHAKRTTIISVDDLAQCQLLETPEQVIGQAAWSRLAAFFKQVKQVQFVVYRSSRSFSPSAIREAMMVGKHLRQQAFDVIHFDNISMRNLGIYPYLKKSRIVVTIHDPVAHSGEKDRKAAFLNNLFIRRADAFVFCSAYATSVFKQLIPNNKKPVFTISLQPYRYVQQFIKPSSRQTHVLFFGRLSPYKGIDLLLQAFPMVLDRFPHLQLVIAGKSNPGYVIDSSLIHTLSDHIQWIDRYVSTEELVSLMDGALCIVCPYRDATQSGVLMTAFAAGRTVIATKVGAFPESIRQEVNGLLIDPNVEALVDALTRMITNDQYLVYQQQVRPKSSLEEQNIIMETLLRAYDDPSKQNHRANHDQ